MTAPLYQLSDSRGSTSCLRKRSWLTPRRACRLTRGKALISGKGSHLQTTHFRTPRQNHPWTVAARSKYTMPTSQQQPQPPFLERAVKIGRHERTGDRRSRRRGTSSRRLNSLPRKPMVDRATREAAWTLLRLWLKHLMIGIRRVVVGSIPGSRHSWT